MLSIIEAKERKNKSTFALNSLAKVYKELTIYHTKIIEGLC